MKALLFAQFGNYVIKKALNYSNKDEQNKLLIIIATMVEDLKKLEFGFKLYNKLISKYPSLLTIIYNMNKINDGNGNNEEKEKYENHTNNNTTNNNDIKNRNSIKFN